MIAKATACQLDSKNNVDNIVDVSIQQPSLEFKVDKSPFSLTQYLSHTELNNLITNLFDEYDSCIDQSVRGALEGLETKAIIDGHCGNRVISRTCIYEKEQIDEIVMDIERSHSLSTIIIP
mmetsp:Transcript_3718/g.3645  ORF Transcript_3718/g.3645 Transcript_3718/m.3645 type:complete len:121 (-) Transcript_3718:550-912(-)